MAFFQLSPIDIATGALNNRISSVIDWIFATWKGASSIQKRILRSTHDEGFLPKHEIL